MKGLEKDDSGALRSVPIGIIEDQTHDGAQSLRVSNGLLGHPNMRSNAFSSISIPVTNGVPNNEIEWRPNISIMNMLRTKNSSTGNPNPSANALDLANGDGGSGAGDIFAFTFKNDGPLNENLTGILLWLLRTGSAANSTIRAALFDVTDISNLEDNVPVDGKLVDPTLGISVDPITLDKDNFYTTALAYAEIAFNDVSTVANGAPIYLNLNYNTKEEQDDALEANKVYAIVIYLDRDGVETGTINIYGSEDASIGSKTGLYFGAAGWGGSLAEDANVKIPFVKLFATKDVVINQIHFFPDTGQTLEGTTIETMNVQRNGELLDDNIPIDDDDDPEDGMQWSRELIHNLILGDQVKHTILFEGKGVIPTGYHLHAIITSQYTGVLNMEINYWVNSVGDNSKLKA